jgi:toxin HigB-1
MLRYSRHMTGGIGEDSLDQSGDNADPSRAGEPVHRRDRRGVPVNCQLENSLNSELFTIAIHRFVNLHIDKLQGTRIILIMPLEVVIADSALLDLATNKNARSGFPQSVEKKFRFRVQQIMSFVDEREFYAVKSLHFEKLKGDRSHQHSIRLNDQWRMILEFQGEAPNKQIVIVGIEDYH